VISINSGSALKMTGLPVVSVCSLGAFDIEAFNLGVCNPGTGLSGIRAVRPASAVSLSGLPVSERDERPMKAREAVAAKARAYAFTAAGAGSLKQTKQHHHLMWAFRGPEPWSDPA
jgi:hypothetical protein